VDRFKSYEVVILDTSGRHKEEKGLIEEMQQIAAAVKSQEIILVLDGTIGQQASSQAQAFMEATPSAASSSRSSTAQRGVEARSAVSPPRVPISSS